jgi:O-antigen/teichoic acid export membrane protein
LLAGAASLPAAALIEYAAPPWLQPGIVFLAIGMAVAQGVFDFAAQHASSTLRPRRYGSLYLAKACLALSLGFLFLRMGAGPLGAVGALILGFLGATAAFGRQAWLDVWRGTFDRHLMPALAAYALPSSFGLLTSNTLQWGDRLILAAYVPADRLGAYGASADLVQQGFGLVCMAFLLASFPRLVAAWEARDPSLQAQFDRYALLLIAFIVPAAVGLALVAGDLATLLLGQAYAADAGKVMPWLAVAALVGGLRMFLFDLPLYLSRRMVTQSALVGGCAVLTLALNILLVPKHGILAAAVVSVIGQTIGCAGSFFFGRQTLVVRIPLRDLLAVAVASVAMAACLIGLPASSRCSSRGRGDRLFSGPAPERCRRTSRLADELRLCQAMAVLTRRRWPACSGRTTPALFPAPAEPPCR